MAVEALSKCSTEDVAFSDYSSSEDAEEEDQASEGEEEPEEEYEELNDFDFDSPRISPASSVSSLHTSPSIAASTILRPAIKSVTSTASLKPALRSPSSESSLRAVKGERKCSFSEEPPKIGRTYSRDEYARLVPFE